MTEQNRTYAPGVSVVVATPWGEVTFSVPGGTILRTTEGLVDASVSFLPAGGGPRRWGDPRAAFLSPPAAPTPRRTGVPGQVAVFGFQDGASLEFHIPFATATGGGVGFNGSTSPYFINRDASNNITNEGQIWPIAKR